MFILEQKYGNNGYAFWFKLLELLGSTDGHYLDYRQESNWEFLQAITHLDSQTCQDILDLLAKLDAIDPELWETKVVWSDNFISNIADAYKNRKAPIPTKPSFYEQKSSLDIVSTSRNTSSNTVSTPDNTHTILKETKVNKTIPNDSKPKEIIGDEIDSLIEKKKQEDEYIQSLKKELDEQEFITLDGSLHPGLRIWEMTYKGMYKQRNIIPVIKLSKIDLPEILEKLDQIWPICQGQQLINVMNDYLSEQKRIQCEPDILACINGILDKDEVEIEPAKTVPYC